MKWGCFTHCSRKVSGEVFYRDEREIESRRKVTPGSRGGGMKTLLDACL